MGVVKATKGLITITPEMNCNQAAVGLPPVTLPVFLIVKSRVVSGTEKNQIQFSLFSMNVVKGD
jgi:hypothetical protein